MSRSLDPPALADPPASSARGAQCLLAKTTIFAPGQAHDVTQALALLEGMSPGHVIADKAYGSNAVLDAVETCGARPIIPPTRRSKRPRDFDPVIYKATLRQLRARS